VARSNIVRDIPFMKTLRIAGIITLAHFTLLWICYAVDWWTTGTTSIARNAAHSITEILTYPPYMLYHFFHPVFLVVAQLPFFFIEFLDSCMWGLFLATIIYGFRRIHHVPAA
jgi:hypothetical protein